MTWHTEVGGRIVDNFAVGERFTIEDVYEWENELQDLYPENNHVRETFRDVVQEFRDAGWIKFEDFEGNYLVKDHPPGMKGHEIKRKSKAAANPEPKVDS